MNTKTCKRCGWVYPSTQPGKRCRICGQPFEEVLCSSCGTLVPADNILNKQLVCRSCYNAAWKAGRKVRVQEMSDRFDEWVAKVASVPKAYPTLTEEQWIEACRFFDGCARCDCPDIDTRGFFIDASLGGRYCDWNVIPLCERCATSWDLTKSVFKYVEKRDTQARSKLYRTKLAKIIEYLGGKLNNAIKSS